jgi:hypothetical protein
MINQVPTSARRTPLKAAQLTDKPLMIEQPNPTRIDQRKAVPINVALDLA